MTETKASFQPGPVFYAVFLGALRVYGTNLKEWSAAHGVDPTNAKGAAHGSWNGPKAHALRQAMIDTVGAETFKRLYRERMSREDGGNT